MKNYFKYLLVGVLLLTPFITKAETIYGFMNGNFYAVDGTLKYACLMDGSCYNYQTKEIESLQGILGLQNDTPQTITVSNGLPTPTPVITPTPVVTPTIVPTQAPLGSISQPLTEAQVLNIVGITGYAPGGYSYKVFPTGPSVDRESVTFQWTGDYTLRQYLSVVFNNQTILDSQGAYHTDLEGYDEDGNYHTDLTGWRNWVVINDLTPSTTYQWQLVYSPPGQPPTVITKSFTTLR